VEVSSTFIILFTIFGQYWNYRAPGSSSSILHWLHGEEQGGGPAAR